MQFFIVVLVEGLRIVVKFGNINYLI